MYEIPNRRILPWVLLFAYGVFGYHYGLKLASMAYTDFPAFYEAARMAFVEKHSPYDFPQLTAEAYQHEPERAEFPRKKIYPFVYPPPSLFMFYPLAHMPVGMAKAAILLVNQVCLLAIIAIVLIPIAGFSPRSIVTELLPASLAMYLLVSHGIGTTITEAQVNLLVLALICLAWWATRQNAAAWMIAIPLAISANFKVYPLLFVGLLAARRRYAAAGLTVALYGAMWGAAWLLLPHHYWTDWSTQIAGTCGYFGSPAGAFPATVSGNISLAGFMARLFLPIQLSTTHNAPVLPSILGHAELGRRLTQMIAAAIIVLTAAITFWSVRRLDKKPPEAPANGEAINLQFSLFLIVTFLIAPLAWDHHLAYVAPAAVIMLLSALRMSRGRATVVLKVVTALVVLIGLPGNVGSLGLPRLATVLLLSWRLYLVLAIWVFLLWELYKVSTTPEVVASRQEMDQPAAEPLPADRRERPPFFQSPLGAT